jgi:Uma2 family endonuclease
MSALPKTRLTALQYLTIENAAEFRSEFFDGETFAMAGATPAHNIIRENLGGELYARIKGGRCRSYSVDQRIKVEGTGLYTYPDLLIVCGKKQLASDDPMSIVNPTAIIEVLSPSTEKYDRGAKFRNYRQIPTLVEYILVAQDEAVCERFIRQTDGSWGFVSFVGLADTLAFHSVPANILLADIYAGIDLPEVAGLADRTATD